MGCWCGGGEFVEVGVAGLLLGPGGRGQRIDELADELADLGGELPAFLGDGLVGDEGAADVPVDLLDGCERVRCGEDFGAVLAERDVDGGGVLAVDGGEAVGRGCPVRRGNSE